ncbi:MAG: SufD family Fe-S cluster assembly protein [Bacteroidales bacterium]|nr:SufD family Fe-S cluster assembly protein [Bacteroidales bacterium]
MSALNQYIDLYVTARDLIDAGSAPVINARRAEAFECLQKAALPRKGSEDYEQTDLEALLAPDFGINLGRKPLEIDPSRTFSCRVPSMSTALFFLMGDTFASTDRSYNGLPEGVIVSSLAAAAVKHPELVKKYYGALANTENPLVALNNLLCQDGFFLYVPKGVKVEKPLQLVNILRHETPMMAIRRLLIVLEEGAEAKLLCCDHTQNSDTDFLNLQTIEIFAAPGARFDFYDLEESSARTTRLSSLYLTQGRGSNVLLDGITLFNGNTRNEYRTTFTEPDAELHLLGMGIEDDTRRLDNYTLIRHDAPHCHSNELMKYVVEDAATGAFSGRIYVAPGAVKTEAYQSNRNMVTSEGARMYSKPQLEIYNDDVKCSHGTAVGQMDEKQLFYMQQRGLSLPVAHTLLKQAFMADVIDAVRLTPLRDRLRMLVDMRFASDNSEHDCAACASSIPEQDA